MRELGCSPAELDTLLNPFPRIKFYEIDVGTELPRNLRNTILNLDINSALYMVRPVIGAQSKEQRTRTRYQELLGRCLVTLFNPVEVWGELPAAGWSAPL